jgi:hypothetical protein
MSCARVTHACGKTTSLSKIVIAMPSKEEAGSWWWGGHLKVVIGTVILHH